MTPPLPGGYVALSSRVAHAAGLAGLRAPLETALGAGSFYAYAAGRPDARVLAGRGIAYAAPLPDDVTRVVVRRSRHGGMLAAITRDRFAPPTRAPRELETALRLTAAGVPTPEVVAYAAYVAGPFQRADIVTREIPGAADLAAVLAEHLSDDRRRAVLAAVARLLAALTVAGARHPDLNIKNVLVQRSANGHVLAYVLDVDRVWFDRPGAARVTERNLARLARSARKWRRAASIDFADTDVGWLAATAHHMAVDERRTDADREPSPAASR